jgi:mono/diheme cytochrome c family protein
VTEAAEGPGWRQALVLATVLAAVGGTGWLLRRVVAPGPPPAGAAVSDAIYHLDPADPLLGRRSYAFCQGCHQPDGQGVPGTFPPLVGHPRVLGPVEPLIRVTLHGYDTRSGLWHGAMPGFAGRLADHEVAAALTFARSQWGNQAPPVGAASVAAVRRAESGRIAAWTPAELPPPSWP